MKKTKLITTTPNARKLALSKETIVLMPQALAQVAGGTFSAWSATWVHGLTCVD